MTDKPGVVLSWLFPEQTSGWFTYSVAQLLRCDAQTNGYITGPKGSVIALSSGPRVAEARNQIVDSFAMHCPDADWLLMIDSDMTFGPHLLNELMAVADPVSAPIVGGLCFAGGKQNDPYPTIYKGIICQDEKGEDYLNVERVADYPRDAVVKVQATGGACLLMHRMVFAAMKEKYGTLTNGKPNIYPWFAEGVIGPNGEAWGEDINFCLRAGALGIPVHVNTGVKLGHVKTTVIDEVFFDNRRALVAEEEHLLDSGSPGDDPEIRDVQASTLNRAQRRKRARQRVDA